MKLRQKLALVMATTMVATAVPTVTIAATSNGMSHTISIAKDSTIGYKVEKQTTGDQEQSVYTINSTVPAVELTASSNHNFGLNGETIYLKAENAKFNDEAFLARVAGGTITVDEKTGKIVGGTFDGKTVEEAMKNAKISITNGYTLNISKISDTELKVDIKGTVNKDEVISIPVFAKAQTGEVKFAIDAADSFVTSGTVTLGTAATTKQQITASVPEAAKLSVDGGKIGDILLTEQVAGSLKGSKVKVKLPTSSDLEFAKTKVTLEGGRGFSNIKEENVAVTRVDDQTLELEIPASFTGTSRGTVLIKGLEVQPEGKTAKKGDVVVTVSSEKMEETKLTVAAINDHQVTLTCKEPAAVVAGKEAEKVKFTLEEQAIESIISGRKAEFSLDNGFIAVRTKENGKYKSALETVQKLVEDKEIKLPSDVDASDIIDAEANAEGQITGFTIAFKNLDDEKVNELEFTIPVMAEINTTGEMKLTVSGRAVNNEVSAVVANVKEAVKVEAQSASLKVGLNNQKGGSIVLTETDKEMISKGNVKLAMPEGTGISFVKGQDLKVEATGVRISDVKVFADYITFDVDRTSEEAGSIKITDIEFNVNRTTPQGTFNLEISGDAISTNEYMKSGLEKLEVKDFVVIGTANTEDITASNGLKKGTASFTIDSNKYTVNGVEKDMDGKAYASNGRTMVPVRYVSEAFGIDGNNITFSKGVVTLFAGNRIVQLTTGSNVALVNGVKFQMDEKVTAKDGRTYIPMGEVGRILGVNVSWDNATKTATFTN